MLKVPRNGLESGAYENDMSFFVETFRFSRRNFFATLSLIKLSLFFRGFSMTKRKIKVGP